MREETGIRNIDWGLVLLYLVLVSFGVSNIYSASYNQDYPSVFSLSQEYGKQILWIGISIVLGVMIMLLDVSFIRKSSYVIYGITLFMLIGVLFTPEINGQRSWFGVGSFGIQPSEIAKLATGLALAKYLTTINIKLQDFKTRLYSFFIIGMPAALVMLQPDAGTFVVFTAFVLVLYREGISGNPLLYLLLFIVLALVTLVLSNTSFYLPFLTIKLSGEMGVVLVLLLIAIATAFFIKYNVPKREQKKNYLALVVGFSVMVVFVLSVTFLFQNVLKVHQKDRIELFLGMKEDPDGKGYNLDRAMAAIGSGGFSGKGYKEATLANAYQKHVPMQSTDFIFCTWAEERGFIGSFLLVVVFVALLIKIIQIAERQRSAFTRIYAYSVGCIIFYHFAINVGMTLKLAPVIGIPLPFFSYGGSSVLSFSLMIFILLKLDSQRMEVLR